MLTEEKWIEYIKNPALFLEEQFITKEGKLLELTRWQTEEVLDPIFNTVDSNKRRIYDTAIIGLPRKLGKSTIAAGLALYFMVCGGMGAEIFGAATDKDQAKIVFNMAKSAIERCEKYPKLGSVLHKLIKCYKEELICEATESIYQVLSADKKGSWGKNPKALIVDELHAFEAPTFKAADTQSKEEEFYYALETSFANPDMEPLTCIITTAGKPAKSRILFGKYQDSLIDNDPHTFMYWVEGEDQVDRLVRECPHVRDDYVSHFRRKYHKQPILFQRLYLNQWVQDETDAFGIEVVEQCRDRHLFYHETPEPKCVYNIGFDLGITRARACGIVTHKDPESGRIFVDNKELWDTKRDKVAADGKVMIKGGKKQVRIESCKNWIRKMARTFNITLGNGQILVDPYEMRDWAQSAATEEGLVIEVFEMHGANISKLSKELEVMISEGMIRFPFNDVDVVDELLSIQGRTTTLGWRIDKSQGFRSDQAMALALSAMGSYSDVLAQAPPLEVQRVLQTFLTTTRK